MKRVLAKRILVGLLTVVMISAGVLPFLVKTANVARANENGTTTALTDEVVFTTEHDVKESAESGYVKVSFIINDTLNLVKYVKKDDTVTVKSTDKNKGVLVGDAANGSAVSEDTTIYVKTYNYSDVLDIKKELVSEEPDEDGNYTLKFTVNAKDLPSIHSATRNDTVLVIDASLSMACATNFKRVTQEYMADTYAKTRWKAMYDAVDSFLDEFLPEGNTKNTVSLVIYNSNAKKITETPTTSKAVVMEKLDSVFNEDDFNNSLANSKKNSDGKIDVDDMVWRDDELRLASKTNVKAGLDSAAEIFAANNNTNAKSIILFTDGVANRPNTNVTTKDITQYNVGEKYTYEDNEYTISKVSYDSKYYVDDVSVGESTELEAAYYANQKGQELAANDVTIYSFALIDNVTDNVRVALGNKNINMSEYVTGEKTVKDDDGNKTLIELKISPKFTYTEDGTGYAKKFYATTSASDLKKEFSNIIASLKELPFESASVTDKLDSHFQLVSDQNGVNDNGDGTFTVKYSDSHIKTDAQTITVKIKAKEGYAGYSYTNDGCKFYGTADGLTYEQDFTDEPAAVIKPDALEDEYTVNQDEKLTVSIDKSVLKNDNNEIVNNPDKNVTITAEKISEPKNGKVTFKEDGTFTYEPEAGFSGEDTFTYNTVLTVGGVTYKKSATVKITVVPKYTQTIRYEYADGTKAADENVQTVIQNGYTTAVASPKITGYKASLETVESSQLTGNTEILIKYTKDDNWTKELSYKVIYYKDGVEAVTENFDSNVWINDDDDYLTVDKSKINVTDKFGTGYKVEKTKPAEIPAVIKDNGVIEVYYVSENYKYSVKYVLEGTNTELAEGYTDSAAYLSEVGADKKNIEGYSVVDADKKLVIGADESQNVLVIEYRLNSYKYSVEYYYDGVKDETATVNKTAQFGTKVDSYDKKDKTGYKFEKTENLGLTIKADETQNVIKVYYVSDSKPEVPEPTQPEPTKPEPTQPETPTPTEPVTPSEPAAPSEPVTDDSNKETVKTGDSSNIMLYILMITAGAAGAVTAAVTGRKKTEE